MNKRKLHHFWKGLRPVSYWYFLIGFIIFGALFVTSYRQNNLRMIELRDQVFVADETGDNLEQSLHDLREYVHTHMNTDLTSGDTAIYPPIQLKHQYDRLVASEKDRVNQQNTELRAQAEGICRARFPNTANVTGIEPCIEGYLNDHGVEVRSIPKELYQFDFISPRWSPDLAGWSLVLTAVFGLLFVTRLSLELWLRNQLREHA